MSLFDQQNLAEISAPEDYPGERLIACYNPTLAADRKRTREELLQATEQELVRIGRAVARRTKKSLSEKEIGLKVGKVLTRYKVAKHFIIQTGDGQFSWQRNEESIKRETELDGIYVIRTSEPQVRLSAADAVRNYKNLSVVERAFRTMKGVDLLVRPIYHRLEDHVRAHIFLCLLAYHVAWHMRQALAPLLFADEELAVERGQRDPVAPAQVSASAKRKKARQKTEDGLPVHSFKTLLRALGTQNRNRCVLKHEAKSGGKAPVVFQLTEPTPIQTRAYELLGIRCTQ
jgi:transposase